MAGILGKSRRRVKHVWCIWGFAILGLQMHSCLSHSCNHRNTCWKHLWAQALVGNCVHASLLEWLPYLVERIFWHVSRSDVHNTNRQAAVYAGPRGHRSQIADVGKITFLREWNKSFVGKSPAGLFGFDLF